MATKVELNTMTFEEALRDALDLGFTTYRDPETWLTMDIESVLEELQDDIDQGPADYIRFRNVLVRASGAWSVGNDALVYELD